LIWICDLAEMCRRQTLNWGHIFQQADAMGCRRMVSIGLWLAFTLCSAPLPAVALAEIGKDRGVPRLGRQLVKRLVRPRNSGPPVFRLAGNSVWKVYFFSRLWDHWSDCFAYEWKCISYFFRLNVNDRALVPLPDKLSFLYYVIRPFRLLLVYGGQMSRDWRARHKAAKMARAERQKVGG
jgi:hypothetical protein